MEQSSPDKLDRGIIVIASIAGLGLGADGAKGPFGRSARGSSARELMLSFRYA